jgi:hypothetical protein
MIECSRSQNFLPAVIQIEKFELNMHALTTFKKK